MSIANRISRYTESLRFPVLVVLMAGLFVADLLIPDVIPFIDEVILGLVLAVLARVKKPRGKKAAEGSENPGDSA